MDRIIVLSESSPQTDLDERKFATFMQRKPIWLYFNISQNDYISKSTEEKTSMIRQYYDFMDNGKNIVFFKKIGYFSYKNNQF